MPLKYPHGDKKIIHQQSSSQPQILQQMKNRSRKRPSTAHPMSPKDDDEIWHQQGYNDRKNNKEDGKNKLAAMDTNSTRLSSWDSDTTVIEHHDNLLPKQQHGSSNRKPIKKYHDRYEDAPAMQSSASVPTHNNNNNPFREKIIKDQLNKYLHVKPSKTSNGTITPSKKGLRRAPKPLPKPLPNKVNKKVHFKNRGNDHDNGDNGNNEEKLPLSSQHDHQKQLMQQIAQQQPNLTNATKRYMNAQTMQYQMTMHHQRHQRTLPPRGSPSPPPKQLQQQQHPPAITRDEFINTANHPRQKFHRHMSEPHIPKYDGPFTPPNVQMQSLQSYNNEDMYDPPPQTNGGVLQTRGGVSTINTHTTPPPNHHNTNASYQQSPNHLPEHHPNPRDSHHLNLHHHQMSDQHISYPDSPGPESPPIAYAQIDDNNIINDMSSPPPPIIPMGFVDQNEQSVRTRSSNSRYRSKSQPTQPPKVQITKPINYTMFFLFLINYNQM